jgi:hypothetical protein
MVSKAIRVYFVSTSSLCTLLINSLYKVTCLPLNPPNPSHVRTFQVPINWLAFHSNARVLPVKLMKYQVNIQTSHHFTLRDPKPFRVTMQFASERSSTHSWIFKEREIRYVCNSSLAVDATWPPCPSPWWHTCARENREGRGGRSRRTCRARATSNQAFVDVIITRKRAPHRVFVAQVFGRNMWAKRRRRHSFSAFWLRSSVV